MSKKLFICFAMMILLLGSVSALDFDNIVEYKDNDMKVDIYNSFLLPTIIKGNLLGTVELKSHSSITEIKNVIAGENRITMYYDSNFVKEESLGEVTFIDMRTGKEIDKDYKIVEMIYETKQREVYEDGNCIETISKNGSISEVCDRILIGYEDYEVLKETKEITKVPNYPTRIGLMVDVERGEYVDAVWTIAGKKIEKHATWTESFNVDLVSYWDFNESSGTNLPDKVFGLHNGTNANMENEDWTTGIIGNGLNYGGTDEKTVIPSSTEFNPAGSWSFNYWFKSSDSGGTKDVLGRGTGDGSDSQFKVTLVTGQLYSSIYVEGSNKGVNNVGGSSADGNWHMATMVYTSVGTGTSTYYVYIDGSSVGTPLTNLNTPMEDTTNDLWFGSHEMNNRYFIGMLDEVGWWNRTLTTDEITNLYNGGTGITYTNIFTTNPTISLLSPIDALNTTSTVDDFTFNITHNGDDWNNFTFQVWNSTNDLIKNRYVVNGTPDADCSVVSSDGTQANIECIGQAISIDDTYHWNVNGCNSDNLCAWASSNYTFTIDGTDPVITIITPTSIVDYGYEGKAQVLNWSIVESNIDSIWYSYNGTNTSIYGLINSTTFNLADVSTKTLNLYANDTLGNIANKSISWNYNLFKNTEDYTTPVTSTQSSNFTINITYNNVAYNSIYGNLIYDGTSYEATRVTSGNNVVFSKSLTIPDVSTPTNKTFFWEVRLVNGTGTNNVNTTSTNQLVNPLNAVVVTSSTCAAGLNSSMLFTFFDESNVTNINTTVSYNFQFGLSQNSSSYSYGNLTNVPSLRLCINTTNVASYYLNYGEVDYQSTGYSERRYYTFTNRTLTATQSNVSIYSLINGASTSFLMSVVDTRLTPYEGYLVTLNRWYPSLNEYKVVEVAKTDEKGQSVLKTKVEDVDYRIGIYQTDGTLIHLTNPLRFVCLESPCSYTITIPDTSGNTFETFNDLSYSLTFNSTSKIYTFIFSDPSQTTDSFSLTAYKQTGSSEIILCNESVAGWTGIITCDVSAYSGTIIAYAFRTASPKTTISSLIVSISNTALTQDIGLFISVFVVIALVLIGLVSPVLTVILAVVALVPALIFGIMPLGIILVLTAMAFIVIHFMKKGRGF